MLNGFMKISTAAVFSTLLLWVTAANAAATQSAQEAADARKQAIADHFTKMAELKPVISSGRGGLIELQEYLYHAMFAVYTAKVQANWDMDAKIGQSNQDLTALVGMGLLPAWPENPLNDFKPMRVLAPTSPFSPGDLVLALCPADYYTTDTSGHSVPMSFEVYVYGPEGTEDKMFTQIVQHKSNTEWSTPPHGAMYGLSFYTQSDKQYAELQARLKQAADKAQSTPPQGKPAS